MDISIIIVNYNTNEHLYKCLQSILKNTENIMYEIIVVDNNSTDREIENFPKIFNNVKFYFNNENNGFGAGCNFGAQKANGKYIVFINPDVEIIDNCLRQIFKYMEINENVAISSGLLVYANGKTQYSYNNFPNFKWHIYEIIGSGSTRQINKLMSHPAILSREKDAIDVDWLMGAFLFTRKNVFDRIKGFDENIFLYMEDIDIQYRIKQLGYKIKLLTNISIVHSVRSSVRSYEGENLFYFHSHRSKMLYMYKHYGFWKRNSLRVLNIIGIFLRIITLPLRKKFLFKKRQKFYQYLSMIKFYFLNKSQIIESKYKKNKFDSKTLQNKEAVYDDFWNN